MRTLFTVLFCLALVAGGLPANLATGQPPPARAAALPGGLFLPGASPDRWPAAQDNIRQSEYNLTTDGGAGRYPGPDVALERFEIVREPAPTAKLASTQSIEFSGIIVDPPL